MVTNAEVATAFAEVADLLDVLGERFKPEAYRRASRSLEALPEGLDAIAARGELRTIPGVGEAIAEKVTELLRTGRLAYLDRLRAQVPAGVLGLMRLPGVGPKTARRFWTELGVGSPAELSAAIAAGRLEGVKGFAEKKIGQLRAVSATATAEGPEKRLPIETVWPLARSLLAAVRAAPSVRETAVAGSFRRARETVGDLDLLATAEAPEKVFDVFSRLPEVHEVRLRGPTKETVVLANGLQVDLRVVEPEAFGAALQYFTGSKDHNIRLRSLAREHGLKVNEYGVYRGETRVAGRTEEEVYASLGLSWIPPELREDRGEIAAAAAGPPPRLVEPTDLLWEPHLHLSPSPSGAEVDRLVAAAQARSVRAVGVVVATVRQGEAAAVASSAVRERLGPGGPVRLLPVVETDGAGPLPKDLATELQPAYLVIVPGQGGTSRAEAPGVPVSLVAHTGGTPESASDTLALARRLGAAVEVGPGPERFGSAVARVALNQGIPLGVPVGLGEPEEGATGPVALGFARRAGAVPAAVLNAQEPPAASSRAGRPESGRSPRPRSSPRKR